MSVRNLAWWIDIKCDVKLREDNDLTAVPLNSMERLSVFQLIVLVLRFLNFTVLIIPLTSTTSQLFLI